MPDTLSTSNLLLLLPKVLPISCTLKSPQDAIVALIHTCMTAVSFRLVGTDDDNSITTYADNILPENWNVHSPGHFTLRYKHEQSSLEFVVKISKLAARTIINAIAVESDKAAYLDLQTSDYTSLSFFPHTPSEAEVQSLVHGFIAPNRITDFSQNYKLKVIQVLIPGLGKEGYTESNEDATPSQVSQGRSPRQADRVPTPPYAGRNPFGVQRPEGHIPFRNPPSIGRRDLDPLPVNSNPFSPPLLFEGPSRGDGMFVGPDHPIFSDRFNPGRGGGIRGRGYREGPWGGDGFLPPIGAPPGARFDPVGPFGSPYNQGPGVGGPFEGPRGAPAGSGPVSGDPDNDEFMPPGSGDMFS